MISIKSPQEIAVMEEGGKKLHAILQRLLGESIVGLSLDVLERHARQYIEKEGGMPSFMTVKGYTWATCLCLNEQVVHGIPRECVLQEGDLLTIDIGMAYREFHTDTAWTKIIRQPADQKFEEKERFLTIGEEALKKAIAIARPGNRVGHISKTIETTILGAGYDVVRSLTGHGIGTKLHEEPMIEEYLDKPIERTPFLTTGMTLAIEVIYAMGKGAIEYVNSDGWTLATRDKSLTAVFEHTIALREGSALVLT